jgi:hypothetical protein
MIGTELLDDPQADPAAVRQELREIARLNTLFGGTRAVVRELETIFRKAGTGDGEGDGYDVDAARRWNWSG